MSGPQPRSARRADARAEPRSDRATALRIARAYLAPRWRGMALALACAAVAALSTGALAWLLNPAIKRIFIQKNTHALVLIPLLIVAAGVVRAAAQIGQARLANRIGHQLVGDVQVELFGRLVRADLARLRETHSGAFVSSVLYDAGLIREAATTGFVNYSYNFLTVVATLGVMISQDVYLAVFVMVAAPAISVVLRRYARRTRKAARGAMAETSALATAVMESLDGVKIVKIDNREAYEQARVAEVIARRQSHIIKGANAKAAAAPATEMLSMVVIAALIAYAGWRATLNQQTLGQFTAFLASVLIASQALRQLANLQGVFSEGLAAARRLFAALDVEPEVRERPDAPPLALLQAHVRFERVGFAYAANAPALNDVTLEARRGETVALVGPSGGGKSTLLNLIPRFYDVSAGRVTVDGTDVREVSLHSLRDRIGLVTQEPFLFDDTVLANIAYARPDASRVEVEAAAREAAAHEFVEALPSGYDTLVGEAGARLSGGQRQRIAIARAFLKDAPILLLDEATSALDTESEVKVQQALARLMTGRTTLMIAHRLSTVRGADRIYVIDGGRVVETGTHAGLMMQGGLYARLARAQNLDVPLAAAE